MLLTGLSCIIVTATLTPYTADAKIVNVIDEYDKKQHKTIYTPVYEFIDKNGIKHEVKGIREETYPNKTNPHIKYNPDYPELMYHEEQDTIQTYFYSIVLIVGGIVLTYAGIWWKKSYN